MFTRDRIASFAGTAGLATVLAFALAVLLVSGIPAQVGDAPATEAPDWVGGRPDGCTSITVGRAASASGWVTTSHTCDSHRTRGWLDIVAPKTHDKYAVSVMKKRAKDDSKAMPTYKYLKVGEIPQAGSTHGFINTAYPCMNDQQLAIGESTFGGRKELRSEVGLIDCQQLVQLMLERCGTAREAIRLGGDLVERHGYIDDGECLTIADTTEVWHFEVVGPGKGKKGAIWVAQRVPDDHVSVNANASRIRRIDLDDPRNFMASTNVTAVAKDRGWWRPADGAFEFCYAYDPGGRRSLASRRRAWRVFDLLAPSLKLDANAENYPFSVKPEKPVTMAKLVRLFQDYYEGTDYNFVKNITCTDKDGKTVISPLANPFMPYDMNGLFNINGGWGWRGERTIARWYTMYATITQSRAGMPNEIGGVVWLAWDNVAASAYVPLYCGITDLPKSFKTPGRPKGFTRDSAWWAFNRLTTLAAQRWGDMRKDVEAVFGPYQKHLFAEQARVEREALALYKVDPAKAKAFLTEYAKKCGEEATKKAWALGDLLWTKYDEKF